MESYLFAQTLIWVALRSKRKEGMKEGKVSSPLLIDEPCNRRNWKMNTNNNVNFNNINLCVRLYIIQWPNMLSTTYALALLSLFLFLFGPICWYRLLRFCRFFSSNFSLSLLHTFTYVWTLTLEYKCSFYLFDIIGKHYRKHYVSPQSSIRFWYLKTKRDLGECILDSRPHNDRVCKRKQICVFKFTIRNDKLSEKKYFHWKIPYKRKSSKSPSIHLFDESKCYYTYQSHCNC